LAQISIGLRPTANFLSSFSVLRTTNAIFAIGPKRALRGYVVIIQEVRGRYASEGEWYTLRNETDDGYDTIEWAAALPYSNGKVGMFGGSYVGTTQMLAAICASATPGRNLPDRNLQQLPFELDVSGRCVRTMVRRIVDDWLGAGHVDAKGEGCQQRGGGNVDAAARPNVILHDPDHPSAVVLPVVRLK
jgi:hypothetical protein